MLTFAGYIKFVNYYELCIYCSSKLVGLFWFWPSLNKRWFCSLNLNNDKSPEDPPPCSFYFVILSQKFKRMITTWPPTTSHSFTGFLRRPFVFYFNFNIFFPTTYFLSPSCSDPWSPHHEIPPPPLADLWKWHLKSLPLYPYTDLK